MQPFSNTLRPGCVPDVVRRARFNRNDGVCAMSGKGVFKGAGAYASKAKHSRGMRPAIEGLEPVKSLAGWYYTRKIKCVI